MATIKKRYLGGGVLILLALFIFWGTWLAPINIDWVETNEDKTPFNAPPHALINMGPDEASMYVFTLFSGPGLTDLREGEIVEAVRSINTQRRVSIFLNMLYPMNVGTEDLMKTLFMQWDQYAPDDQTITWKLRNFFRRATLQTVLKARNNYPKEVFMDEVLSSYGLGAEELKRLVEAYNAADGLPKEAVNPAIQQHFSRVIVQRTPQKLSPKALVFMKEYLEEPKMEMADSGTYQEAVQMLNAK